MPLNVNVASGFSAVVLTRLLKVSDKLQTHCKLEVLREHRPPSNASIIELLNDFCNAN